MSFPLLAENLTVIMEHESGESTLTRAVERIELNSEEEKSIIFNCLQERPGKVKLQGLRWSFGNVFYGSFKFTVQEFLIKPPVSGLSVDFINFPETLIEGEVKNLQIVLRNQNLNTISGIFITFSHGFLFGRNSINLYDLAPGEENKIEMWMRGETIGIHTIRFVVTYQSQEEKRYCRLQSSVEIKPSLKITTRYDISLKSINESILQLYIKPALQAKLSIKQISSLSLHSLRLIKELASEVYYIGVQNGGHNSIQFDQEWLEPTDIRAGFCWDIKNMLKKGDNNDLDLIISWELEINGTVLTGHHYLLDLKIQRDPKKFSFNMALSAPIALKHDFKVEPICKVPVKVCIKNLG
jgi:hypothetical protein